MRAVVKYANQSEAVEVRDTPVPDVTPGTVLVKVAAVGVCGSDIPMWHQHPERELEGRAAGHTWARVGRDHPGGR